MNLSTTFFTLVQHWEILNHDRKNSSLSGWRPTPLSSYKYPGGLGWVGRGLTLRLGCHHHHCLFYPLEVSAPGMLYYLLGPDALGHLRDTFPVVLHTDYKRGHLEVHAVLSYPSLPCGHPTSCQEPLTSVPGSFLFPFHVEPTPTPDSLFFLIMVSAAWRKQAMVITSVWQILVRVPKHTGT